MHIFSVLVGLIADLSWVNPMSWRRWFRRLFMVTTPVSVPLWLALFIVMVYIRIMYEIVILFEPMWNAHRNQGYDGYRRS